MLVPFLKYKKNHYRVFYSSNFSTSFVTQNLGAKEPTIAKFSER